MGGARLQAKSRVGRDESSSSALQYVYEFISDTVYIGSVRLQYIIIRNSSSYSPLLGRHGSD